MAAADPSTPTDRTSEDARWWRWAGWLVMGAGVLELAYPIVDGQLGGDGDMSLLSVILLICFGDRVRERGNRLALPKRSPVMKRLRDRAHGGVLSAKICFFFFALGTPLVFFHTALLVAQMPEAMVGLPQQTNPYYAWALGNGIFYTLYGGAILLLLRGALKRMPEPFWTGGTRVAAGILGVVVLLLAVGLGWIRFAADTPLRREYRPALQKVRELISAGEAADLPYIYERSAIRDGSPALPQAWRRFAERYPDLLQVRVGAIPQLRFIDLHPYESAGVQSNDDDETWITKEERFRAEALHDYARTPDEIWLPFAIVIRVEKPGARAGASGPAEDAGKPVP